MNVLTAPSTLITRTSQHKLRGSSAVAFPAQRSRLVISGRKAPGVPARMRRGAAVAGLGQSMAPAELVKRNVPATTRKAELTRVNSAADGAASVTKLEGSAAIIKVIPYVATTLLGAFLFGYHLGVVNAALEYLAVDIGIASSTALQGLVVSITLAGAFAGSVFGGSLNDKFGRCKTFLIASMPLVLG
eukprot:6766748-Pyramimonas_sp.AAC.1